MFISLCHEYKGSYINIVRITDRETYIIIEKPPVITSKGSFEFEKTFILETANDKLSFDNCLVRKFVHNSNKDNGQYALDLTMEDIDRMLVTIRITDRSLLQEGDVIVNVKLNVHYEVLKIDHNMDNRDFQLSNGKEYTWPFNELVTLLLAQEDTYVNRRN